MARRGAIALLCGVGCAALAALAIRGGPIAGTVTAGRPRREALLVTLALVVGATVVGLLIWAALRPPRLARALAALPLAALLMGAAALLATATLPLTNPDGTSQTPPERKQQERSKRDQAQRDRLSGTAAARFVRGGDGRLRLALDGNGDGRIDGRGGAGFLVPCPGAPGLSGGPRPEEGDGFWVGIDEECDGTVDRWIEVDLASLTDADLIDLAEFDPEFAGRIQRFRDRDAAASPEPRSDEPSPLSSALGALAGVVFLLVAALLVAALLVVVVGALVTGSWPRLGRRQRLPEAQAGDTPDVEPDASEPMDAVAVLASFGSSIDAMLAHPDPRTAIVGAYARLLDGLDAAGLARQPQEAPEEHLRRCLAAFAGRSVRPEPLALLGELFALARFSHHPLDESHRQAALGALRDAAADLQRNGAALAGTPA